MTSIQLVVSLRLRPVSVVLLLGGIKTSLKHLHNLNNTEVIKIVPTLHHKIKRLVRGTVVFRFLVQITTPEIPCQEKKKSRKIKLIQFYLFKGQLYLVCF
jgi:hypothetical protein